MNTRLFILVAALTAGACDQQPATVASDNAIPSTQPSAAKSTKSMQEWKSQLPPETFHVMFERGTESPFRNAYFDNHAKGTYVSAATGVPLFRSEDKFESGTGWPSFTKPIRPEVVKVVTDNDLGMVRDEVVDVSSNGHLGHVFDDGPPPTGKRYCMNSAALKFIPDAPAPATQPGK